MLKTFKMMTCAAAFVAVALPSAHAFDKDVVRDEMGRTITDSRGNCVYTKWQSIVDGCLHGGSEAGTVYFNFNSAALTTEARQKLSSLASMLRKANDIESITVVGYADMIGSDSYNRDLSRRRANAVRSYLQSRGVKQARNVTVRGLGENNSVTRCSDVEDRNARIRCLARDRRVELQVTYR
jgi:outer membrane protein OmpA-like peptidoglycan-associated protein